LIWFIRFFALKEDNEIGSSFPTSQPSVVHAPLLQEAPLHPLDDVQALYEVVIVALQSAVKEAV
jgi:hypothetical protein